MKIILKFLLVVLIMWPVYAQSQEPSPSASKVYQSEQSYSHKNKKPSENFKPLTGKTSSPLEVLTQKDHENTTKDKDNRDDKTSKDWWLIAFTGALAIVGFLQAIILWRQLRYHRLMERAYIFAAAFISEVNIKTTDEGGETSDIIMRLYNSGKTPGFITTLRSVAEQRNTAPIDLPKIVEYQIPPGLFIPSGEKPRFPISFRVSTKEWKQIKMGNITLYCYGRVDYEDVFGRKHKTGFCWQYYPRESGGFMQISDNKKLNYRT